jgi:hypothetical protein
MAADRRCIGIQGGMKLLRSGRWLALSKRHGQLGRLSSGSSHAAHPTTPEAGNPRLRSWVQCHSARRVAVASHMIPRRCPAVQRLGCKTGQSPIAKTTCRRGGPYVLGRHHWCFPNERLHRAGFGRDPLPDLHVHRAPLLSTTGQKRMIRSIAATNWVNLVPCWKAGLSRAY